MKNPMTLTPSTAAAASIAAGTPQLDEAAGGAVTPTGDAARWYQDAVIYQLNVKAFFDSNSDGVGDFKGVTSKLDYVKDLGVNTIWLMPFYPSPLRDDGYDISDYDNVHPQYGTLDDFKEMLAEAHKRDLKVLTELVINHTSDQHPWFQAARNAPPGSPERDFYVWSDTDQKYKGTRIIFTDTEVSNWTYDPVAKAYFWHRFFSHQPDLNYDNPAVLQAIFKTMRFWLDMGVDGFRLDAIPYLIEREGTSNENLFETHAVIKQLRAAIDENYPNRFLLAEANMWPEDVREYFGNGDECHACYHFPLMPRMYMAIAQEDRFPLTEIMQQTPDIPAGCQWVIFLRNHDELTLEMVTSKERDYMYSTYAADPRARINLGIRRRLAPLMDNDTDRIKLMNSLLLSMRGSPIVYYGDEIGMGDNVFVGDRNGVRTPMQWSPDRNAGFSRADPQRLYLPPIMDAVYGYEALNVEAQQREPASLLNWMRRMLAVRSSSKAFGRGELLFLKPGNRKILAYLRSFTDTNGDEDVILCVVNLARSAQPAELDISAFKGRVPVEMLGRTAFPPIGELPYLLTIPAHGFYWFKLTTDVSVPSWHQQFTAAEDRPVMVLFDGWNSLFRDHVVPWRIGMAVKTRAQFETDVLPSHVEAQRWYADKGTPVRRAALLDHAMWENGADTWMLPLLDLQGPTDAVYFVPLALAWEDREEERYRAFSTAAVARVRQQAEVGVMADAFADERFCRAVINAIGSGKKLPAGAGSIRFTPTAAYAELAGADIDEMPIGRPQAQSSNTIVTVNERLFLKGYRRIRTGVNPEFEVGRFLTEVARFPNCAPVAGAVEYVGNDGQVRTLCLLQAHVSNQGDGWVYTLGYLERFFEERRTSTLPPIDDVHGGHLALMQTMGQRTAEMHLALATRSGNAAFDPEPLTDADTTRYRQQASEEAQATFRQLEAALPTLTGAALDEARAVLSGQQRLLQLLQVAAAAPNAMKTRVHGDFHLAQVLVTKNDFVIVDFEGEPGRSFDERRAKHSPLRDVAGMLRSFSYARASGLRSAAHTADEETQLAAPATEWEAVTRAAFLQSYLDTLRGTPLAQAEGEGGLLRLFELQKAFYELRYELNNRPDWVRIPLAGILGFITSGEPGPSAAATAAKGE
ncbi:MAG: maltose alpha-D-glucosyltransferase [Rhodoferax sp.]|nr:maltose alpha-D-glucosyltransferase [Rhodoferax sp.]